MGKLELLHRNAKECRILADTAITAEAREVLLGMAQVYEDQAANWQAAGIRSHDSFGGVGE